MFIGEYQHTIDEKGRLAIPVKFRAELRKGAVVTKGLDSCLFVYSLAEWKKLAAKVASLPFSQADNRAFSRQILGGAMDAELDAQGRVILPEYLRRFAGLAKDTVITGLYDRLEIWDKAAWTKYQTETEKNSNEIAERLGGISV
ncbi:MAG: division/cell wall cluster transcriptional repressor MraZ [Patescibacteria group bacterium]|jgi:MraZ protein